MTVVALTLAKVGQEQGEVKDQASDT